MREETPLTVKVAGVVLGLKLWDELGLLPQKAVPVQVVEELVVLHLTGATYRGERSTCTRAVRTGRADAACTKHTCTHTLQCVSWSVQSGFINRRSTLFWAHVLCSCGVVRIVVDE